MFSNDVLETGYYINPFKLTRPCPLLFCVSCGYLEIRSFQGKDFSMGLVSHRKLGFPTYTVGSLLSRMIPRY